MGRGAGDLSKAVKKACSIEETAPKRKHVRACIVYTWDTHSSKEFFHILKNSTLFNDPVQLFKMLTLIHKVIQEGHPSALIEGIRNRSWIKSLARMSDGENMRMHGDGDGYDRLIRKYVEFLVQKLNFHAHHRGFRNGTFEYKEYISLISINDLDQGYETILQLMALQDQVDEFSNFVFASINRGANNDLKISSLVPLISESYGIYKFITSMVRAINTQLDDDGVLDLLKEKVEQQHLRLFEFYADCSSIKLLSSLVTIPKLPRDPPNLTAQLDVVPQTSESLAKPQETRRAPSPQKRSGTVSPQQPPRPQKATATGSTHTAPAVQPTPAQHMPATTIAPLVPMLTAAAFPQAAMMTGGSFINPVLTGGPNMFLNMHDQTTGNAGFGTAATGSLSNAAAVNNMQLNTSLTGGNNITGTFPMQQQMPTTTFGATFNTSQMTGGMMPAQITGGLVPAHMTGGMMPAQVTGGLVPAQATGGMVPAQATGGMVPAQLTGSYNNHVAGQVTGGMVPAQLTGSFNSQMSSQLTSNVVSAQGTNGMISNQMTGGFQPQVQSQSQPPNNFNNSIPAQVTGGFNSNMPAQLTGGVVPNMGMANTGFGNATTSTQQQFTHNNPMQTNTLAAGAAGTMLNQLEENQKLLEQYDIQLQKNESEMNEIKERLSTTTKDLTSVQERYDALSKLYSQLRQEHLRLLPRAQNSTPEETLDFVLQGAINSLQSTPSSKIISKYATDLATHMNNFIFSKNDFNNVVYAATLFSSSITSLSSSAANSTNQTERDNVQRVAYQAQTYLNKLKSTTLAPLSTEAKTDAVINANIEMQRTLQLLG
ncbi:hypothetical protein TPHA_0D03880 [Tetrapisispora phaffii CBS 4417]|uniref:ENTH domain-containing protein n=1 Tax=Tetrapisispora phaffii (strain ATCC 24235 / CBS 4417 / NBRC 1672 / NRRL Y-8282 / UCD 70-5) TaxID=1071381 RepID=G8BT50_TETPH|nr:hypothetical protein TPHA_0D03880 [Tetrapisispora phaffii CBS 4417]CCE63021.1 hypothetical protein TPHA_0D03880 [Tetrapisispora phaffii CBS 4417]